MKKNEETGHFFSESDREEKGEHIFKRGLVDPMVVPEVNFGFTSNNEFDERQK